MVNDIPLVLATPDSTEGKLLLHNGQIITVGSDEWFQWLIRQDSFRFESGANREHNFTARKHERYAGEFWYAYKKISGKLKNAYLGKPKNLTLDKLLEIALKLSDVPKRGANEKQLGNSYATECITEQLGNKKQDSDCITIPVMQELQDKVAALEAENQELRSRLEMLQASEKNVTELLYECHSDAFKAADILKAALKLKSNAGGAIKREIKKALPLIDDV